MRENTAERKRTRVSGTYGTVRMRSNICVIRVLEERRKRAGPEKVIEEIMVENFQNLEIDVTYRVKKLGEFQKRISSKKFTPRHI